MQFNYQFRLNPPLFVFSPTTYKSDLQIILTVLFTVLDFFISPLYFKFSNFYKNYRRG